MTHLTLFLLPLVLLACGDKDDTTDTAADTAEAASDCIAGDMAGDWTGFAYGDETIPQSVSLSASANIGESMGLNFFDGSHYGEGYHCSFAMNCVAGSDGETLEVYNVIVEAVPDGACGEGAYTLSLFSADELLVQYLEEGSDEVFAEGILTR
ncbi:MAG: hypothetical protein ACI8S6_005095 [Myxococcota bacterium]|jgi:hypothetical protein